MDVDDAFGHWLAGFTDGEGSFIVARVSSRNGNPNAKTWPNAKFAIGLRADDRAVLHEIRVRLGLGRLYVRKPTRGRENTQVVFTAYRITDCLRIVELFQRYPLRAKKRQQFELWARAVAEIAKGRRRDETLIDAIRRQLTVVAGYDAAAMDGWEQERPPVLRHRKVWGEPPLCLCGCGEPTSRSSHPHYLPHPDNPNFCRYLRGHWRNDPHFQRPQEPAQTTQLSLL